MRYVAGILAAIGILLLLAYGSEGEVSGREREGFEEGPAQALVAAPAADPAPVITVAGSLAGAATNAWAGPSSNPSRSRPPVSLSPP